MQFVNKGKSLQRRRFLTLHAVCDVHFVVSRCISACFSHTYYEVFVGMLKLAHFRRKIRLDDTLHAASYGTL